MESKILNYQGSLSITNTEDKVVIFSNDSGETFRFLSYNYDKHNFEKGHKYKLHTDNNGRIYECIEIINDLNNKTIREYIDQEIANLSKKLNGYYNGKVERVEVLSSINSLNILFSKIFDNDYNTKIYYKENGEKIELSKLQTEELIETGELNLNDGSRLALLTNGSVFVRRDMDAV